VARTQIEQAGGYKTLPYDYDAPIEVFERDERTGCAEQANEGAGRVT